MSRITLFVVFLLCTLAISQVSAHEFSGLEGRQQACFARAMVGMDSVINSRLGVPPEHAIYLSALPLQTSVSENQFDNAMLNVILSAYLWNETPHLYAVNVFFKCASNTSELSQQASIKPE